MNPLPLLEITSSSSSSTDSSPKIHLNESTLKTLKRNFSHVKTEDGIDVVCVTGKARIGKSSFANCWILNEKGASDIDAAELFAVRDQVDSCSKGVNVYPQPLSLPNHHRKVLLLDCEGLEMEDEHRTQLLHLFCILIGSSFMIHSRKTLDNTALTQLASTCQMLIDLNAEEYVRDSTLFFVLRDTEKFRLRGRSVTPDELLQYFTQQQHTQSLFEVIGQIFRPKRSQILCKMSSPPKNMDDEDILNTETDMLQGNFEQSNMYRSFLSVLDQLGEHSHAKRLFSKGINMHISEIILQMRSVAKLINENQLHSIPDKLSVYAQTRMKKMKKKRLNRFTQTLQEDSNAGMMNDERALRRYLKSVSQRFLEEFHSRMVPFLQVQHHQQYASKCIRSLKKRMDQITEMFVSNWRGDHPSSERSRKNRKRKRSDMQPVSVSRRELKEDGFKFAKRNYKWRHTFHDHSHFAIYAPTDDADEGIRCDQCQFLIDDYEVYSVGSRFCSVTKNNVRMELPVDPLPDVCHVQCYEGNASLQDVLFDEEVTLFEGYSACPRSIRDYYLVCCGKRKMRKSIKVPFFVKRASRANPQKKTSKKTKKEDKKIIKDSTTQRPKLKRRRILTSSEEPKARQQTKKKGKKKRNVSPTRLQLEALLEDNDDSGDDILKDLGLSPQPDRLQKKDTEDLLETTAELLDLPLGDAPESPTTGQEIPNGSNKQRNQDSPSYTLKEHGTPFGIPSRRRLSHGVSAIRDFASPHLSPIVKNRTPTLKRQTHKESWTPDILSGIFSSARKSVSKENCHPLTREEETEPTPVQSGGAKSTREAGEDGSPTFQKPAQSKDTTTAAAAEISRSPLQPVSVNQLSPPAAVDNKSIGEPENKVEKPRKASSPLIKLMPKSAVQQGIRKKPRVLQRKIPLQKASIAAPSPFRVPKTKKTVKLERFSLLELSTTDNESSIFEL